MPTPPDGREAPRAPRASDHRRRTAASPCVRDGPATGVRANAVDSVFAVEGHRPREAHHDEGIDRRDDTGRCRCGRRRRDALALDRRIARRRSRRATRSAPRRTTTRTRSRRSTDDRSTFAERASRDAAIARRDSKKIRAAKVKAAKAKAAKRTRREARRREARPRPRRKRAAAVAHDRVRSPPGSARAIGKQMAASARLDRQPVGRPRQALDRRERLAHHRRQRAAAPTASRRRCPARKMASAGGDWRTNAGDPDRVGPGLHRQPLGLAR